MSSLEESSSNDATPNLIHIHSVHEEIKPFQCKVCDYKTSRNFDLKKHTDSVHEGIKPFKCNICEYECARNDRLKKHIDSVHEGIKPFKCKICDYRTAEKRKLMGHIESVHERIKPFKCHICQYKSALKSHLKTHITFVHEKKKNENNISKSGGHRNDQEVSFQCIKVEPSTLEQSQPSESIDPLLIHEFKQENFKENETIAILDLSPVYIKQEEVGASKFQNEQDNEMIDIKEEWF